MMRVLLFVLLAAAFAGYAFWIYGRAELSVPAGRWLAMARASVFVVILLLLFDVRLPAVGDGDRPARWVLLDASLSMAAVDTDGLRPWEPARERARLLEREGWNVVRFGDGRLRPGAETSAEPDALLSRLAPALETAAESGARQVRVLSDLRFEDAVAVRAALETLPMNVEFERFGGSIANAGIGRFVVPDLLQPDGRPVAELEVHGGALGDSIEVEIFEEDRPVARVRIPAANEGLRSRASVELPSPAEAGRRRFTARVAADAGGSPAGGDALSDDDLAVAYASVGFEEGAVVLVSLRPDWEPRYLLPVLEEVTGLSVVGYLRAGPDRFVRMGSAPDRGPPADSASVRQAAASAALLIVHGLGEGSPSWIAALAGGPGRRLVLPIDAGGAAHLGMDVSPPRPGEWYASPDVPTSPIAGSLAGISLQGLPPLGNVLVPGERSTQPPLQLQLRGAGAPESAVALMNRVEGRAAVMLASGFWRWSMREAGREPYRRFWSGVAGWLLADERVATSRIRPGQWVVPRGAPVVWSLPDDTVGTRIVVSDSGGVVLDTTLLGGQTATRSLPPAAYRYSALDPAGDTLASGRFDVASTNTELLPAPMEPEMPARTAALGAVDDLLGPPLRTTPWPYLLVLLLLCGEWVVRRRSGLR